MASVARAGRVLPSLLRRIVASQQRLISTTGAVCARQRRDLVDIDGFIEQLKKEEEILAANTSKGYWNTDWKPGPAPVTEEERVAAAKKYHLHPDDYTPLPNLGDYPDLGDVPDLIKDPYGDWDYPNKFRNYGEPVHIDQDIMASHVTQPKEKFKMNPWYSLALLLMSTFLFICILGITPIMSAHKTLKQYPYALDGSREGPHFTFEPTVKKERLE